MTDYAIVKASVRHIKPVCESIRPAHAANLMAFDLSPRAALRRALKESRFARTAILGGRPVAMWGVKSTLLSEHGFIWLAATKEAIRFPVSLAREARRQVQEILRQYHEISTTILPDDGAGMRFAIFLGFHDRDEQLKMKRKWAMGEIIAGPVNRVPFGDSHVIALSCHDAEGF